MKNEDTFAPILDAAQAILAQAWHVPIRFASPARLTEDDRRSLVLRLPLENAPDGLPSTVILKKMNLDALPAGERDFARQRFAADWAGNVYLSAFGARHSPAFYGGDPARQFILLEDFGEAPTLVDPLLHGTAAQAEAALCAFATRLGQMHADTLQGDDAFKQIAQPLDAPLFPYFHHNLDHLIQQTGEVCAEWAVPFSDAAQQDLQRVSEAIRHPGPFQAYIHADPCPDNMYWVGDTYRLIDFETSGFTHALADAVYFRMSFPTCWCANRIPDDIIEMAEAVYRAELARTCPAAADDRAFFPALVEMCGFRVLVELGFWLRRADENPTRAWGLATLRPRIGIRLQAFIQVAAQVGHLTGLRRLCERVLETVENRWGEVAVLPFYPAFRE